MKKINIGLIGLGTVGTGLVKALLAVHGREIFEPAQKRGADLYYEASVCGAIPIIKSLREGLASNRIHEIRNPHW